MFFSLRDWFERYPDRLKEWWRSLSIHVRRIIVLMVGILFVWALYLLRQSGSVLYRTNLPNRTITVLIEGVKSPLVSYHPIMLNVSQTDRDVKYLLYRRLINVTPEGQIVPDILRAWSLSENKKVLTLYLKRDLVWNNGQPITADDVLFTFDFIRRYYPESSSGKLLKNIEIEKEGEYAIVLRLKNPTPNIWEYLDVPIMSEDKYREFNADQLLYEGFLYKPVTSGMYQLLNVTSSEIRIKKEGNTGFGEIRLVYDQDNTWEALIGKRIHSLAGISFDEAHRLRKINGIKVAAFIKLYNIVGLFINSKTSNKLLQHKGFRYFLYQALDRDQIASSFMGKPAYSVYPDTSNYFHKRLVRQYLSTRINLDDILKEIPPVADEVCKQINKQTCYVVQVTFPNASTYPYIYEKLRDMLQPYNIVVVPRSVSVDTLHSEILPLRDYEVLLLELSTNVDPDQYSLWHSSQKEYPGLNVIQLESRRLDRVLLRGRLITSPLEREQEYLRMQEILFEYMYFIPIFHPAYLYAYWEDVVALPSPPLYIVSPEQRFDLIQPAGSGSRTRTGF